MSKRRFIQSVIVRSLPAVDKLPAVVDYAESLWDGLTARGYGSERPAIRESKDYYQDLTPVQRRYFDAFWRAFAYKADKNGAAMRWGQLGWLTEAEYQQIIAAAGAEAIKAREPGQVRKMAQGWLHDKRYLDYQAASVSPDSQKNHVLARLNAELLGIKRLFEASQDEALLAQIDKLEKAIQEARR
jgi:hypothetical protein